MSRAGLSLSGIALGDYVKLTWPVDPAYGGGTKRFKGEVKELDDWIRVVNDHGVVFYGPVNGLEVVKLRGA